MSDIPAARELLRSVADGLWSGKTTRQAASLAITRALVLMTRESPVRRAPVRKRYVTKTLAQSIRTYARLHPKAHLDEIAAHFDVNPGRVSEVLNGKR